MKIPFLYIALLCAGVTGFFLNVVDLWDFTVDDAYITFRYAQHFAHGHGFVWNIGAQPVEGFTSFLHVVVLAGCEVVGISLPVAAKILGVAATLLIAVCFLCVGSLNIVTTLATIIFLIAPASALHSVSGLETMPYALALVACVLCAPGIGREDTPLTYRNFCLLGLLAGLLRPEGVLFFGTMLCFSLVSIKPSQRNTLYVAALKWFFLPGLAYFLWRFWYFTSFFPNTFYVKSTYGQAGSIFYAHAVRYIMEYCTYYAVPFILIALLQRGAAVQRLFLIVFVPQLLFYATVDTSIMGYVYRFLIPLFPVGLAVVVAHSNVFTVWRRAMCCVVTVAMAPLLWFGGENRTVFWWVQTYAPALQSAHGELAKVLATNATKGTLLMSDVGIVPYNLPNWQVIDYGRLNDAHLARHPFDAAYLLKQNPDVIVLVNFHQEMIVGYEAGEIAKHPLFESYVLVRKYQFDTNYWLFVFVRNDPALRALMSAFHREDDTERLTFSLPQPIPKSAQRAAGGPIEFQNGISVRYALSTTLLQLEVTVAQHMTRSYKIFVHLKDSSTGEILKQFDAYPAVPFPAMRAQYAYITDIPLVLPDNGQWQIEFGFFDESDPAFSRLNTSGGESSIVIKNVN